jgi:hypothetical protein
VGQPFLGLASRDHAAGAGPDFSVTVLHSMMEVPPMTQYRMEDLQIRGVDPVATVRARPSTYAGEEPRGPRLAALLVRDLIWLDALPASVERFEDWWLIATDCDWLALNNDSVSMKPFFEIVNFPIVGQFGMRTEILINALAEAVVTWGSDGETWISDRGSASPVPAAVSARVSELGTGRLLAYKYRSIAQS